jgi:hypothetical protein
VAYYASPVDVTTGAWGTIIPNNLPNGVRRVEERAFAGGGIVLYLDDNDGIWDPGAINTVNPAGGTTAIELPMSVVPARPFSWGMVKNVYR